MTIKILSLLKSGIKPKEGREENELKLVLPNGISGQEEIKMVFPEAEFFPNQKQLQGLQQFVDSVLPEIFEENHNYQYWQNTNDNA